MKLYRRIKHFFNQSSDKGIESEINNLLLNKKKLEELLFFEKERREVNKDKLVFIGMANVAGYYWCAMQSFYKNQKSERGFFSAYLIDRLLYSYRLGLISRLPRSNEKLLEVGSEIAFSDIEKLLRKRARETKGIVQYQAVTRINKDGDKIMVVNPDLSQGEKQKYEAQARIRGVQVASPEEFPKLRGELLQTTKGESHPTIRWNFNYDDYIVVGIPDGITDKFVYEFKTTRNRFLLSYIKPVATAQADIYGYFFKRKTKRVQIYITEESVTETWEGAIDIARVEKTLNNLSKIETGVNPIPPKEWKCKLCEFKEECKLSN